MRNLADFCSLDFSLLASNPSRCVSAGGSDDTWTEPEEVPEDDPAVRWRQQLIVWPQSDLSEGLSQVRFMNCCRFSCCSGIASPSSLIKFGVTTSSCSATSRFATSVTSWWRTRRSSSAWSKPLFSITLSHGFTFYVQCMFSSSWPGMHVTSFSLFASERIPSSRSCCHWRLLLSLPWQCDVLWEGGQGAALRRLHPALRALPRWRT